MPREEKRGDAGKVPIWQRDFIDQIRSGHAVPLISNKVTVDLLFGDYKTLVRQYADRIQYPLSSEDDLLQMAKFKRFSDEEMTSDRTLKFDYIDFLKNRLFDRAEADGLPEAVLEPVSTDFDKLKFSEFSSQLGYPRFDDISQNPLLALAELPLPIYLTTSQHNLIELALKAAGKEPETELCRWWQ